MSVPIEFTAVVVVTCPYRGLTQHLDIHDFDDYVRSKHRSLDKSTDLSQRQPSDKYLSEKKDSHDGINSPKAQSTSNRIISATDALHNCADVNHIAQAVKVKLDHRFVSLDEAFKKLDVKQTGYVSKQEFLDACWYWGVQLQETDFAIITAEAGDGGTGRNDGRIDYSSFIKLMSRITHAEYPVGATHKEVVLDLFLLRCFCRFMIVVRADRVCQDESRCW